MRRLWERLRTPSKQRVAADELHIDWFLRNHAGAYNLEQIMRHCRLSRRRAVAALTRLERLPSLVIAVDDNGCRYWTSTDLYWPSSRCAG